MRVVTVRRNMCEPADHQPFDLRIPGRQEDVERSVQVDLCGFRRIGHGARY